MEKILIERFVKPYYDGLEEGILRARKCKECGAIEFPPHPACNTCGYHETEWTTVSGKGVMKSIVVPGLMTSRDSLKAFGPYVFGVVQLEEGPEINATIYGVKAKDAPELRKKLPLPVHAKITQLDGFKTVYFELDEI